MIEVFWKDKRKKAIKLNIGKLDVKVFCLENYDDLNQKASMILSDNIWVYKSICKVFNPAQAKSLFTTALSAKKFKPDYVFKF